MAWKRSKKGKKTSNGPSQDYIHLDDHNLRTYDMTSWVQNIYSLFSRARYPRGYKEYPTLAHFISECVKYGFPSFVYRVTP